LNLVKIFILTLYLKSVQFILILEHIFMQLYIV